MRSYHAHRMSLVLRTPALLGLIIVGLLARCADAAGAPPASAPATSKAATNKPTTAAPGSAAPGAAVSSSDPGRLGYAARPTFQAIRLEVDADRPDYSGSTRIELDVPAATASLRFHAKDLKLGAVKLSGPRGVLKTNWAVDEQGIVTLTPLTRALMPPGAYVLEIDFTNSFDSQANSLYRLKYRDHWYTFTQFEADAAREAFPCWDEPEFKQPFQITLIVPKEHIAISNTPIESSTAQDSMNVVVFARTKPLPSYLLAIATGPFDVVPIPGMSIPGNVITVKGSGGLAGEAVAMTPPLLEALEHYFDSPYPYEKLDLLAVPEYWAGAMENPGAITYTDNALLLDPQAATVSARRRLAEYTAHELAHMWFGDLVTMAWWDDLWLNESFATWMGAKVVDNVYPDFRLGVTMAQSVQRAMEQDANLSTHAMRRPVSASDNLLQSADDLAYQKGAAVLGMFESWLGEDRFRRGVLDYLEAHAWKNATAADLWAALGKAGGQDVAGPMATFLDQEGVPLVSAQVLPDGGIELRQRRFLHYGVEDPASAARLWTIPVSLSCGDGATTHTQTVLLSQAQQQIPLPAGFKAQWVHPDAGGRGYYRWNVPTVALQQLADRSAQLLSPRERVALAGNVNAMLDGGELHGDAYLRLLERLAQDPSADVVAAVLPQWTGVRFVFINAELADDFARYVRRALGPPLERFGLQAKAGEPETVETLRPGLMEWLGRWGRDPAVLQEAHVLAERYLADPHSVPPALAGPALQLTAQGGDWKLYNRIKAAFESAEVPAERSRYLAALASFGGDAFNKATLRYSLNGSLRPQEIFAIPQAMAMTQLDPGSLMWDWMTENYDAIAARVPAMVLAYMPFFAMGCDTGRLEAARQFFAQEGHKVAGTERTLAQVSEAVEHCAELRDREGKAVTEYLHQAVGMR